MVKLLVLFLLLSFTATAQKSKPLTLKFVNARIDSLVLDRKISSVNNDKLYAEYKVMQARFDTLLLDIDLLHRKINTLKITKETYRVDTIINDEGQRAYKWSLRNATP